MSKMQLNFAAAGFLFLAAVMTGCLNPVSFNTTPPADEALPGAAVTAADTPVTIRLLLEDEAASGVTGSRSVAGPDYDQIVNGPGMLNYAQVIIYDKNNQVIEMEETWFSGTEKETSIQVKGLNFVDPYTFLVLIGHWQRDYAAEQPNGQNEYIEEADPTLVAVGYSKDQKVVNGEVTIDLSTIRVDTKFNVSGSILEPVVTDGKQLGQVPTLDDRTWNVEWAIKGSGFGHLFSAAGKNIEGLQSGDFDVVFTEKKGIFIWGTSSSAPEETEELTTSDTTPKTLTLAIPKKTENTTGWVNFNLAYTAFNGLAELNWGNYDKPGGWIIRNGINDEPQNESTVFMTNTTTKVLWAGTAKDTCNGNGAVEFNIQTDVTINMPFKPD